MKTAPLLLVGFLILTAHGTSQQSPKEIVLDAAELATGLAADKPTAGKWWLRRDARALGAPNGNLLVTGEVTGKTGSGGEWKVTPADRFVPYRVPALIVDPKATGWHRIYVGLLHEAVDPHARLLARL